MLMLIAYVRALVSQQPIMFVSSNCRNKASFSLSLDGPVSQQPIDFHLNGLSSINATGTFLVTPQYTETEKPILKKILRNHTVGLFIPDEAVYSSRESISASYQNASNWMFDILGVRPRLIRIPETYRNEMVVAHTQSMGYVHVPVTMDYYSTDCARVPIFDADSFIKKKITSIVKPWDVFRYSSACTTDIYSQAIYYRDFMGEFQTPEYCLQLPSAYITNQTIVKTSTLKTEPTLTPKNDEKTSNAFRLSVF